MIFFSILSSFSFKIDKNLLEKKCLEFSEKNALNFGVVITNPQKGNILFVYDQNIIFNRKYCPGSLLKPFGIISVSKSVNLNIREKYKCIGKSKTIDCWNKEGHGEENLLDAVSNSCNFYFYKYFEKNLSLKNFIETLNQYKFSIDKSFKDLKKEEFLKSAIGLRSEIKTTPIDILFSFNSFFNDGLLFDKNNQLSDKFKINPDVLDILTGGMKSAYIYGTAKTIYEKTKVRDFVAKTGTGASLRGNEIDYKNNTGWVVLLYPSESPNLSILVIVENNKSLVSCEIAGMIVNLVK